MIDLARHGLEKGLPLARATLGLQDLLLNRLQARIGRGLPLIQAFGQGLEPLRFGAGGLTQRAVAVGLGHACLGHQGSEACADGGLDLSLAQRGRPQGPHLAQSLGEAGLLTHQTELEVIQTGAGVEDDAAGVRGLLEQMQLQRHQFGVAGKALRHIQTLRRHIPRQGLPLLLDGLQALEQPGVAQAFQRVGQAGQSLLDFALASLARRCSLFIACNRLGAQPTMLLGVLDQLQDLLRRQQAARLLLGKLHGIPVPLNQLGAGQQQGQAGQSAQRQELGAQPQLPIQCVGPMAVSG